MRVNDAKAFILKRQDYGDSSLLVDIFSRDYGRAKLLAKGAKSGRGEKARSLQPFQKLVLSWSGRSELKTLTQIETERAVNLSGDDLNCGFYLNELLWHFLDVQDPHEDLYDAYESVLDILAGGAIPDDNTSEPSHPLEIMLRKFEFFLFREIGYGLSFEYDSTSGEEIRPEKMYRLNPECGPVSEAGNLASNGGLVALGEQFLALAKEDFTESNILALAKQVSRRVIDYRLNGRELHSRKLFRKKAL